MYIYIYVYSDIITYVLYDFMSNFIFCVIKRNNLEVVQIIFLKIYS